METDALQNRSTRTMVESFDSSPSCTEVITEEGSTTRTETQTTTANTIRLRLTRKSTKSGRRVSWTTDTVDNEMLNKKKSKCCCLYQKPKNWNESSSEDENDDTDCEHCKGHKKSDFNSKREKKKHEQGLEDTNEHENNHEQCSH